MNDRPHCSAINSFALRYIAESKPDIVVLSFSPSYETNLSHQTRTTINELHKIGIGAIVVVGPPPLWPKSFPEILLRTYMESPLSGVPSSIQLPSEVDQASIKLDADMRTAAKDDGAIYVSVFDQLCRDGKCTAIINGEPSVFDRFHITLGASVLVARSIYTAMKSLN